MKTKQPSRQTRLRSRQTRLRSRQTRQPLVSVIMPVYNAGDFLVEAIESILSQTYQCFELIIVDDLSTDNSRKIITRYQTRYPAKIQAIHMEKNLNGGGDLCANRGLQYAKGKYVARMDADDIAHPQRLAKQVAFLEKNPGIFLVGSNAYVINKEGKIIGEKQEPSTTVEIYRSYCTFHPLIHPSCMYRRILSGKPFRYKIRYSANNDYYTFFKLLCQGKKFVNLPEKLLYYRIHGHNDTFVKIKEKFFNTLKTRLLMVCSYGYQLTMKDVFVTAAQTVLLFVLPEKAIKNLYLLSKGIIKPVNPFMITSYILKRSFYFQS